MSVGNSKYGKGSYRGLVYILYRPREVISLILIRSCINKKQMAATVALLMRRSRKRMMRQIFARTAEAIESAKPALSTAGFSRYSSTCVP